MGYIQYLNTMKIALSISIIVIGISLSCVNSNTNNDYNNISLEYDSIVFKADSFSLSFYKTFTINSGDGVFIGYNSILHSLDLFSLEDERFMRREILNSDGPNAVPVITSLLCHNSDSTFLFCLSQVILLNKDLKIKAKYYPYKCKGMIENNIGQIHSSNFGKLLYHGFSGTLIVGSNLFEDNIEKPILAAYDLSLDSIYFLPVYYPQKDFKNGSYGLLKQVNYSYLDDTLLYYGFAYTPGVFTFNFNKCEYSGFPVDIKVIPGAKPIRNKNVVFEEMNDHAIQSPMFFEPLVTSNYIVQIFQPGQDLINKNGEYNNFGNKDWNMLIYSRDGKFIENKALNGISIYRNSWFIYNDEIYFCPHPTRFNGRAHDMTSLIFYKIKLV